MRYSILFSIILMFFGCQNPTDGGSKVAPLEAPLQNVLPVNTDSPTLLRDYLRKALRQELNFTVVESRAGLQAKKSYSFDVEENNGRPTWILKEKYHDITGKLYAGAEYMMLWETVDVSSIKIVNSADGTTTGISIQPTEGDSFVYRPYSNDPNVSVKEVVLGWYDRTQDAPVQRVYAYLKKLADNMEKWEE
ncbi:MAG: hypothetical protein AAFZ15_04545 [Bacteroidota bacterium]